MHMVVVVVALAAFVFAKCVAHRIIGCGNGMDDAFIDKSLQCAVNSYPVELLAGLFFDIAVRQRAGLRQKKLQYARPAARNAQLVAFQQFLYLVFNVYHGAQFTLIRVVIKQAIGKGTGAFFI
jgi:hypothetical protein